jgi:hypothetical protein
LVEYYLSAVSNLVELHLHANEIDKVEPLIMEIIPKADNLFDKGELVDMLPEIYRHGAKYFMIQKQLDKAQRYAEKALLATEKFNLEFEEGDCRALIKEIQGIIQ